jgi:CheY-like chemotaxis protein
MSQPTVLVVDDEAGIRESLRRLLLRAGWLASTAASPSEALAALASARLDAAILDVRMPDGSGVASGLELLALLRTNAAYRRLPVIVLTGHFLTPDEEALVRQHDARVLYKPVDVQAITDLLSRFQREAVRNGPGTV